MNNSTALFIFEDVVEYFIWLHIVSSFIMFINVLIILNLSTLWALFVMFYYIVIYVCFLYFYNLSVPLAIKTSFIGRRQILLQLSIGCYQPIVWVVIHSYRRNHSNQCKAIEWRVLHKVLVQTRVPNHEPLGCNYWVNHIEIF